MRQTPAENAEVFRAHFQKLYGRSPDYDPTVVDMIQQQAIIEGCDHSPTDEEIRTAVGKLRFSGPGDSGLCAQSWKCLLKSEETFEALTEISSRFGRPKLYQQNGKQVC